MVCVPRPWCVCHGQAAVDGVMCRSYLNVGWTGDVYCCDFSESVPACVWFSGAWARALTLPLSPPLPLALPADQQLGMQLPVVRVTPFYVDYTTRPASLLSLVVVWNGRSHWSRLHPWGPALLPLPPLLVGEA